MPDPMPETPPPGAAEDAIQKIRAEVSALCHGERFQMSIPVRPDEDSDTIICDALRVIEADLLALRGDLAAMTERLRWALENHAGTEGIPDTETDHDWLGWIPSATYKQRFQKITHDGTPEGRWSATLAALDAARKGEEGR